MAVPDAIWPITTGMVRWSATPAGEHDQRLLRGQVLRSNLDVEVQLARHRLWSRSTDCQPDALCLVEGLAADQQDI
jgi:hypothetical protein